MAVPHGYPREVRQALERLLDDLVPAAPEPSALVVYGRLAKGSYRPIHRAHLRLRTKLEGLCAFEQGVSAGDVRGLFLGVTGVIERAVVGIDALEDEP